MAAKLVAMQFVLTIRSRPNDATSPAEAGPTFSSDDDTGLITRAGTYNRPPNPGETVFTSERAAISAGISINTKMQVGLGQNVRMTVYGKPCGAAAANANRQLQGKEPNEVVYAEIDTVSAGLHDAIRYANLVPNANAQQIRTEAGPEAELNKEAPSGL